MAGSLPALPVLGAGNRSRTELVDCLVRCLVYRWVRAIRCPRIAFREHRQFRWTHADAVAATSLTVSVAVFKTSCWRAGGNAR
jgi:hypothetical protein